MTLPFCCGYDDGVVVTVVWGVLAGCWSCSSSELRSICCVVDARSLVVVDVMFCSSLFLSALILLFSLACAPASLRRMIRVRDLWRLIAKNRR